MPAAGLIVKRSRNRHGRQRLNGIAKSWVSYDRPATETRTVAAPPRRAGGFEGVPDRIVKLKPHVCRQCGNDRDEIRKGLCGPCRRVRALRWEAETPN